MATRFRNSALRILMDRFESGLVSYDNVVQKTRNLHEFLSNGCTLGKVREIIRDDRLSIDELRSIDSYLVDSICLNGRLSVLKYFLKSVLSKFSIPYLARKSVRRKKFNFVKYLIENDILNADREFLIDCVSYDRKDIIRYIVSKCGIRVDREMINIAARNNIYTFKYLLEQIPIERRGTIARGDDEDGERGSLLENTPLRNACIYSNFKVVKYLIETYGVDIGINNGVYLKHLVCNGKLQLKEFKYLIKKSKGKINIREPEDMFFRYSAAFGNLEMVQYFVEKVGVDVNIRSGEALVWACENGQDEMVDYLVGHGANPQVREGVALNIAIENGDRTIVEILIERCNLCVLKISEELIESIEEDYPDLAKYLIEKKQRYKRPKWAITNNDKGKEALTCKICFEKSSNIVAFKPCGHILCSDCAFEMFKRANNRCPCCRETIDNRIKLYF